MHVPTPLGSALPLRLDFWHAMPSLHVALSSANQAHLLVVD
jgi:hypothetical protein